MFCPGCGQAAAADARRCRNCGQALDAEAATSPQPHSRPRLRRSLEAAAPERHRGRMHHLRLDQPVALKFLPDGVAYDTIRLAQFHNADGTTGVAPEHLPRLRHR